MKKIFFISLLTLSIQWAFCGNTPLAFKSAIIPGMGQISAGVGDVKSMNTLKGLGIMAGFTFCLHGMLNSISERESYAEETQVYADKISINRKSGNSTIEAELEKSHKNAYDNYNSANTWTFVYVGLTAAIYGYGIIDAYMFTKEDEKKEVGLGIMPRNLNLSVSSVGRGQGLNVNYKF